MIFPASTAAIESQFFKALKEDDFIVGDRPEDGFSSVRSFIRKFGAYEGTPPQTTGIPSYPGAVRMSMTFGEFLAQRVSHPVGDITLATFAMSGFCMKPIRMLAMRYLRNPENSRTAKSLFAECGASNGEQWVESLLAPRVGLEISAVLYQQMVTHLRHRTLHSFFLQDKVTNGFSFIGDRYKSGFGIPLPSITLPVEGGTVTVTISVYDEDVGTDCVRAFEWHAALRRSNEPEDDVRVCGMLYRSRRIRGVAVGRRLDLMLASDSYNDVDVLQVHSFLTQHEDAEDVFKKSDLCFVWLWERRDGAPKGQGAVCLSAVLRALQERYKNLNTVILDVKPRQFVDWQDRNELAEIALEKQASVEALAAYIRDLKLGNFDVRFIFNGDEGDGDAALRVMRDEQHFASKVLDNRA